MPQVSVQKTDANLGHRAEHGSLIRARFLHLIKLHSVSKYGGHTFWHFLASFNSSHYRTYNFTEGALYCLTYRLNSRLDVYVADIIMYLFNSVIGLLFWWFRGFILAVFAVSLFDPFSEALFSMHGILIPSGGRVWVFQPARVRAVHGIIRTYPY